MEKQISRRRFLKSLGKAGVAAAAAVVGVPAIAKSDKIIHWKMVTTWPKNFPAVGVGANTLARYITEMSGGRIRVKVYGADEIVPAFEAFDAVSRGTAQLGHGASYYWKGKIPAAQFFASIPFGFTAPEMNAWLYFGGGLSLWQQAYKPFHIIPFPVGNTDVQMGGWFQKTIDSVDDLKGLKIRIPGLGGEVIKRAGAIPVNIPGGEVFTALQAGTIDAVEWVGPYNDLAFGLNKAAKYYYSPGWHEPGTALECLVNRDAYLALPKDLQNIVTYAMQAANMNLTADYTAQNARAYQQLLADKNIIHKRFPDEVLAHLANLSEQVVNDIAKQDKMAAAVYDSYQAFRKILLPYHDTTVRHYLNARAS